MKRRSMCAAWLAMTLGVAGAAEHVMAGAAENAAAQGGSDDAIILGRLNEVRRAAGVPALVPDAQLAAAARGHSAYLLKTGRLSHRETDPATATPEARMIRAGVVADRLGELVYEASGSKSDLSAGLFVSAVYHRLTLLCPELRRAGVGPVSSNGRSFLTVDLADASRHAPHSSETLITWPPNGMRDVPAAINPGVEAPDPLPGRSQAGYPVSIQVGADETLKVDSFELREAASGDSVAVLTATHESDDKVPAWGAFILARSPLRVGTQYEAAFTGDVGGKPRSLRWRFTTATPLLRASANPARAGQRVEFFLSGIDPTETYAVCVSGAADLTDLRLDSATRFSFHAAGCPRESCAVAVRVGYDSGCTQAIAATTVDVAGGDTRFLAPTRP